MTLGRALWALGLWAALLAGILVAWSPRYWAVSVAIGSVSTLLVAWLIFARDIKLPMQTPLVVLIGAFGFLQVALHTTVLPQITIETAGVWALGAGVFIVSADITRDRSSRKMFLTLMLWSMTILAMAAMFQAFGEPDKVFGIFPATGVSFGTLLSRNQFAAMMEIAAPIALWYTMDRNPVFGGLCYAMILAAAFTAASRAGVVLIGLELVVFLVAVLATRPRQAKASFVMFGGVALLVGAACAIAGTDQIKARFEDKDPYAVRRELTDSTIRLIEKKPVTGYGVGTWRSIYPQAAVFDSGNPQLAFEAHNDWAQWTSDGGIPFLILMLGLVLWILKPAVESIWGIGVIGVMAHSYVDYPIREPALSFLWFAVAGAVSQYRKREIRGHRTHNE